MTRGKVLQYNQNDGSGVVLWDGGQHPFKLAQWAGDSAPTLNRLVTIETENGALTKVVPVPEAVLIREKSEELKQVLGKAGGQLGIHGKALYGNLAAIVGTPVI